MECKVFDINSFLTRNNMIFEDLAEKLDCSTGLIGMWTSGKSFASFDKCLKLMELGMTAEEMFGTELFKKITLSQNDLPEFQKENDKDFESRVCEILIKYHKSGINGIGQVQ